VSRQVRKVTIPGVHADARGSRDNGKTFVLTEMSADQAEWWAARAFLALTNAGASLPDGARQAGMAGFAMMGVEALYQLRAEVLKPLMDEMFECVQYEHDPRHPLQPIVPGTSSQIEEVATRIKLRLDLLELHTGFTGTADKLTSGFASPAQSPAS
jgi:hypothetical protein